jgi:hypothetical protein
MADGWTALFGQMWDQITDKRVHAPHYLHTAGSAEANLIKG